MNAKHIVHSNKVKVRSVVALSVLILLSAQAWGDLCDIPQEVPDWLNAENNQAQGAINDIIKSLKQAYMDYFATLLKLEPEPQNPMVLGLMHTFIAILVPFYTAALLLTGAYFIFHSASPSGRARAKSMLLRLIASMILITLSVPIFMMLVDLEHFAKDVVLMFTIGGSSTDLQDYANNLMEPTVGWFNIQMDQIMNWEPAVSIPFFLMIFTFLVGPMVILAFRYMALIFLAAIFPVTIFLYSFEPTRKLGRGIFKVTVMWIFVSFVEAVVLVVYGIGMQSVGAFGATNLNLIQVAIAAAGALMLIVAPMILLGIMNWVAGIGMPVAFFAEPLAAMVAALESIEVENE
ncbi:MAG: hypothetical protein MSIBF_06600 [Candidatus Altiarchaeales archaeon IMC4]|nr:MAG: hypothetical protein MSIBF_06600 [Candidatus Altiarchaeales archaeon IMC4]